MLLATVRLQIFAAVGSACILLGAIYFDSQISSVVSIGGKEILDVRGGDPPTQVSNHRCRTVGPCDVLSCAGRGEDDCWGAGKENANGKKGECQPYGGVTCYHGEMGTTPGCWSCSCLWNSMSNTCYCDQNSLDDIYGYDCTS